MFLRLGPLAVQPLPESAAERGNQERHSEEKYSRLRQRDRKAGMNMLKSCVLMELLVAVTCADMGSSQQTACYILDGILILYCIVVTALLFREKALNFPGEEEQDEGDEGLYQELTKQGGADQYEVLNPLRVRAVKEKTKSTEDK